MNVFMCSCHRLISVTYCALIFALGFGLIAQGTPLVVNPLFRSSAFISPANAASSECPSARQRAYEYPSYAPTGTVSRAGPSSGPSAAGGSGKTRCFAYPLTFGGGARGGGEGEGRVALVTGASRGIGLAIAKTLSKAGVERVICVARDQAACEAAAAEVRELGADSSGYGVDVSDGVAVSQLCEQLLQEFGKVDILVNNAGITKDNLFIRMTAEEWHDVINTNLNSAFYFSSPIVKKMVKNRFGRVINMASVVGVGGNAGQANYAASKAGLIGFTKSLAKEYAARNVTANAIAPGFIKSAMTDKMTNEARMAALASVPAGRLGTPQEVADLAAFLASDQSGYINGKVIPIDGAMLFGGN